MGKYYQGLKSSMKVSKAILTRPWTFGMVLHVTINQETESTGNKAGLKQILHRILVGTALESGKSN